jgi:uncharacterized protein (TIGR03118 family)
MRGNRPVCSLIRTRRAGTVCIAVAASAICTAGVAVGVAPAHAAHANRHGQAPRVTQHNLVSDQPGHARLTDPSLVNAWGMSHGPDTPLWVSDNGSDVSTLYSKTGGPTTISKVPLTVSIPSGAPTGQVFNNTKGFVVPGTGQPALFIFDSENGVVSAWNQSVSPTTAAKQVAHSANAVYKGLALVHSPFGPLLLATDFHHGRIDVFNRKFKRLHVSGLFRDRNLPHGYAPFGIAAIAGRVMVTYAKQDSAAHDDVKGAGHGFVDVFTTYGAFVRRLVSRGDLNSPWGLVRAPSTFGPWAGQLLVGNFGDGAIHAYRLTSGAELGTLRDHNGKPVVIDGLWGLLRGDPSAAGKNAVWFSAGPDDETHGLLGTLTAG